MTGEEEEEEEVRVRSEHAPAAEPGGAAIMELVRAAITARSETKRIRQSMLYGVYGGPGNGLLEERRRAEGSIEKGLVYIFSRPGVA